MPKYRVVQERLVVQRAEVVIEAASDVEAAEAWFNRADDDAFGAQWRDVRVSELRNAIIEEPDDA